MWKKPVIFLVLKLISLQIWSQSSKYTFSFKSIWNILLICVRNSIQKTAFKTAKQLKTNQKTESSVEFLPLNRNLISWLPRPWKSPPALFLNILCLLRHFFKNCWRCLFNLLYCVIRVIAISPRQCVLSDVLLFKPRLT